LRCAILMQLMLKSVFKSCLLTACLGISACSENASEQHAEFYVFGTILEVTTWGAPKQEAQAAFSQLQSQFQENHHQWHAWEPGLLTEINRGMAAGLPVRANSDIAEMVRLSQLVENQSGGRFNPAIGGLIGLWGFHTSEYPVEGPPPSRSQIQSLVEHNPSSLDIRVDELTMTSANPSVQLDFGGIAKGYAIDRACDTLKNLGVENAIVNAGGDLRVFGTHGTRPWKIAVRNPAGGVIGTLESAINEAIFTSGNYERFRQDNEIRYPHILDPRTGWPVKDVASVTVITEQGWLADAAATALIVAGLSDWVEVTRSLNLELVMLVDESGKAHLTRKMAERMTFAEGIKMEVVDLQIPD
jgi:thiamine biosynthesis lipoprotein